MKIAVVILNWNTVDYLRRFLPPLLESAAVFNAAPDFAEVVVADSGSTDGSMEMLAAEFPSVRRIPLGKNYGFTGGYNRALADPGLDSFDLFVLLNSDIEVTRDWLRPLADWMKTHPDCGACGPKLHSWYERDKFEYAGAAGGLIDRFGYPFCRGRVMGRVETDSGQYDTPADVLWVTGACLAVRTTVWKSLGGLDGRFFAHMEEIDLCWRMQLAGWRVTVVPESTVYHLGGGTLPQSSPQKLYLNYRNNLLLLDNNLARTIGRKRAELRIFARKILDGCSAAVYLLSFRKDCFKAVWKAHRDAAGLIAEKRKTGVAECPAHGQVRDTRENGRRTHAADSGRVAGIYGGCIILRTLLGLKVNCSALNAERSESKKQS